MALPKLVGQGVSSAAGAIGKSVKTGAKAFGALAASQMEPEALAGIAGIKTLAGKFKGGGGDSGDLSQLQQSVEEVAPETTGPIVEKLEQIPPQTSEPIVEKIEELKEAKEAEEREEREAQILRKMWQSNLGGKFLHSLWKGLGGLNADENS